MLADLEPSGEGEQGRHLVSKPGETSCLDCSMRGRFGVLALDRQFLTSADAVRGDIHFAAELSLQRIAANVIACRGWHQLVVARGLGRRLPPANRRSISGRFRCWHVLHDLLMPTGGSPFAEITASRPPHQNIRIVPSSPLRIFVVTTQILRDSAEVAIFRGSLRTIKRTPRMRRNPDLI